MLNMKKQNYCIDCGIEINRRSKRCIKHANLEPTNRCNGNFLKKHYCIDCNKELGDPRSIRCHKCANINNSLERGIKGFPTCSDCGKKLTDYRSKRCKKCNVIYNLKIKSYWGCAGKKGKYSYTWIDGRSFEPYTEDFTEQLKESIRKRDNYECQNCGMTEKENLIVVGRVLTIHHIDYNKENCKEDNLITTCLSCNIRANFNRKYWQKLYKEKLLIKKEL